MEKQKKEVTPHIKKEDWLPISQAVPGQEVFLYNGRRAWRTIYHPILADPSVAKCPATHFVTFELPYPQQDEDKTKMDEKEATDRKRYYVRRCEKDTKKGQVQ